MPGRCARQRNLDEPAKTVFEISDRVAFMHQGKMWLDGTVAEVMEKHDPTFEQFLAGSASDEDAQPAGALAAGV